MKRIWTIFLIGMFVTGIIGRSTQAEELFKKTVGTVRVAAVKDTSPLQVPFILWGGDAATFLANGNSLTTKPESIFQKQGLNLKLVPGDDFIQQVRDYMSGKSPFLRGTFRMIGMASEVIGSDPRTKGVMIMQMTWSAGDHVVARQDVKTVTDLKGKTVALQTGGPHVGLLDDVLKTGKLTWDDIKIKWVKDISGPNGAAELFRKDKSVDACCVVTPDMIGLTGGLTNTGTGAEGTVKGARVLVSTAELSRSIADVYVCRKDFYDANKELVTKFVAGYLKACEEIVELKKKHEAGGDKTYQELLKFMVRTYGTSVLPNEEEAHGLILDCAFVGYPGNVAFFKDSKNLIGFEAFQKSALDLAVSRGYASVKTGLFPSGLDYDSPIFTKYLTRTDVEKGDRFRAEAVEKEIEALSAGGALDDKTIVSFVIYFEPLQSKFSAVQYGAEFQRVVEMSKRYGNAVIAIRGHADPTKTLFEMVKAGLEKGILRKSGNQYALKGRPLNLKNTSNVLNLIDQGDFDGVAQHNPRATMQAALNLSRQRAEAVKKSIVEYAKQQGIDMDESQIQPVGVGVKEPFIPKPRNMDEAKKNMRVEFRLLRVAAEVIKPSDFDF